MSKPEDIPQDVWDAADAVLDGNAWNPIRTEAIARTIMAERERCAKVAGDYIISGNSIHPDVPFERLADSTITIAHTTCQHVAAAIRKGAQ